MVRSPGSYLFLLALGCSSPAPLPYAGFVDAPVSAVASQLAGKVVSIPVREGDRVKKGDLLAQLESSEYEASLAEAEANVDRARQALKEAQANLDATVPSVRGAGADIAKARAALEQARLDVNRAEQLVASNSVSASDLDAARARLLEAEATVDSLVAAKASTQGRVSASLAAISNARAGLRSSEASLLLAKARLAETHIVAPFDGAVVSRNLEDGEWAAPGTAVVTVEDTSRPWVRLDVEETQFASLSLGAAATVRVVALPGRMFRGHVAQIGAEGDFALDRDVRRGRPDVRTFLVRIAFDDPPETLRPGMTAEVRLAMGPAPASRPPGASGPSGAQAP
jgi:multidrug resistance efflux pump